MSNLAERLDSFPEPWKPKPGEKLLGELVDLDMRASDYGEPYPILTILDDNGREWSWHGFHQMARSEVAKKRPRIGERIGVAYHGKGTAAKVGMSPPERWRVLVDRQATPDAVDWEAVAGSSSEEPTPEDESVDPGSGDELPF